MPGPRTAGGPTPTRGRRRGTSPAAAEPDREDPARERPAPAVPTPARPLPGPGESPAALLPVRARPAENLGFLLGHALPARLCGGTAAPRPRTAALLDLLGAPVLSATVLRRLRRRHGGAPVVVRAPAGPVLLLFDPADLARFHSAPLGRLDPATAAHAAQAPAPGPAHREAEERALASGRALHPSCAEFLRVVGEEAAPLTAGGLLDHARIRAALARTGRRVVLGDAAAEDTDLLPGHGVGAQRGRGQLARPVRLGEPGKG
ncbi:hypothetical protein ABTZ17_31460, partial [Streptomyces sp. NPDC097619]